MEDRLFYGKNIYNIKKRKEKSLKKISKIKSLLKANENTKYLWNRHLQKDTRFQKEN